MTTKKKNNFDYFPPEKVLEKTCNELSVANYPRVNIALPKNATSLEKSKYFLCKQILTYKLEHNLSVGKLAKQINIPINMKKAIHSQPLSVFILLSFKYNRHR